MPDDELDQEPEAGWADVDDAAPEPPVGGHDDIMKRLLDYQRSLREGASPTEAAEIARLRVAEPSPVEAPAPIEELEPEPEPQPEPEPRAETLTDVEPVTAIEPDEVEAEISVAVEEESPAAWEPAVAPDVEAGGPTRAELQERITKLEGTLERLESRLSEIRKSFQDMAVAADERLAAVEDELGEAHREDQGESS